VDCIQISNKAEFATLLVHVLFFVLIIYMVEIVKYNSSIPM